MCGKLISPERRVDVYKRRYSRSWWRWKRTWNSFQRDLVYFEASVMGRRVSKRREIQCKPGEEAEAREERQANESFRRIIHANLVDVYLDSFKSSRPFWGIIDERCWFWRYRVCWFLTSTLKQLWNTVRSPSAEVCTYILQLDFAQCLVVVFMREIRLCWLEMLLLLWNTQIKRKVKSTEISSGRGLFGS